MLVFLKDIFVLHGVCVTQLSLLVFLMLTRPFAAATIPEPFSAACKTVPEEKLHKCVLLVHHTNPE